MHLLIYKKHREWPNLTSFLRWRRKHLKLREDVLRAKLSPLEFHVTQEMGAERPFTGEFHWTKDHGMYSCRCCSQKLFMSDHKYDSKTGYATYWNHMIDALEFKTDHLYAYDYSNAVEDPHIEAKMPVQRAICSHCESHLGHVFNDGPAPFFKRI